MHTCMHTYIHIIINTSKVLIPALGRPARAREGWGEGWGEGDSRRCRRLCRAQICVTCGDGFCRAEDGEDCLSCPADCGVCRSCGDGMCDEETESCFLCPADCGPCEDCGNRICEGNEDCASCRADCGVCSVCGNGVCEEDDFESCVNCPADCGQCAVTSCREIVGCVFTCFDLRSRPPMISLACIGECTARGCADVQFFVDQVVSCAIGSIGGGGPPVGGFQGIFAACSEELEACYRVSCPPSPNP